MATPKRKQRERESGGEKADAESGHDSR